MSKPTTKKPRLVEVTDEAEKAAVDAGQRGEINKPIGFWWDGRCWAEAGSLKKWRGKQSDSRDNGV